MVKNAPRPLPETVSRLGRGAFFVPLTVCIVTLRARFGKSFLRCLCLRNWGAVNKMSLLTGRRRQDVVQNLEEPCDLIGRLFCIEDSIRHCIVPIHWKSDQGGVDLRLGVQGQQQGPILLAGVEGIHVVVVVRLLNDDLRMGKLDHILKVIQSFRIY